MPRPIGAREPLNTQDNNVLQLLSKLSMAIYFYPWIIKEFHNIKIKFLNNKQLLKTP